MIKIQTVRFLEFITLHKGSIKTLFTLSLILFYSSFSMSNSSTQRSLQILSNINNAIDDGALETLQPSELSKLNKKLKKALLILESNGHGHDVICGKEDSTDYAIFRASDGKQIGNDKAGNSWCQKSLKTAIGGAVCAPEDSTDFAYFNISTGKQIGDDKAGSSFCKPNFTSSRGGVVCAPEDSTDFAIFRISDGKQIGDDKAGASFCNEAIKSVQKGLICAPEDSTDYAIFRISDGEQVSSDFSSMSSCLNSIGIQ